MFRSPAILFWCFLSLITADAGAKNIIIADSLTHIPLPRASIFNKHGELIGISDNGGSFSSVSTDNFPLNVRYLGFKEKTIYKVETDTIFLGEDVSELPEVIVESKQKRLLHVLAYVREYSSLSTYTDTIFLFREKMVDYIFSPEKKIKFKGWTTPRTLVSRSYYHFTNDNGLDSVSDACNHHFSWSDWIGIAPDYMLPSKLRNVSTGTDTIQGKYSPCEIWDKRDDHVSVNINVLADTASRKWVQNLKIFFRNELDFETFKVRFDYADIINDSITAKDLSGYSFCVESKGRGHEMFRFNRRDEPFFVSTSADVFILDKEFITVKEAKKWTDINFSKEDIEIYQPVDIPELSQNIHQLIERVNNIDITQIRLNIEPDQRLKSNRLGGRNFKLGRRALFILKNITGISAYKSHKKFNSKWNESRIRNSRKTKSRRRREESSH